MNTVLLGAGAAAVLAAAVGGGLKAFDVEVPVVATRARQVLLFAVGVAFLAAAWLLRDTGAADASAARAYRDVVGASCDRMVAVAQRAIAPEAQELGADGMTYRKEPLLRDLRRRYADIAAELDALWRREPPEALRGRRDEARAVAGEWLTRFRERLDTLERIPHDPITDRDVVTAEGDTETRVRMNDAMSALAGRNCAVAGT